MQYALISDFYLIVIFVHVYFQDVFEDVNTVVDLQLDTRIMENYVPTENEAVDTVNGCVRIILTRHPNTELRLTISCGYPIAVSPTGTCCLLDGNFLKFIQPG